LPFMSSEFLKLLHEDDVLLLPHIKEAGPKAYRARLQELFGQNFSAPSNENLFFDLMLATAYLDQLAQEEPLTVQQQHEVLSHFANKNIGNYLLYRDEMDRRTQS